jgi:glycerol uptake operon antiterminator
VDSQALEAIESTVSQTHPDCIELMPGILPTVVSRLRTKLPMPVIAGGLVETKEQVISLLSAGASGISTGREELWIL